MADAAFEDPRLARLYDLLEGARPDLGPYLALAARFEATRVLDLGCGTGTFACLLARRAVAVTGVDPARASLDVARGKPFADRVRWVAGDASAVAPQTPDRWGGSPLQVDLVTMTGNVAQAIVAEEAWRGALGVARTVLAPGGRLVFETRRPDREAWRQWTPDATRRHLDLPSGDHLEVWTEVLDVRPPLVTFRRHYRFGTEPSPLWSDSTLRFRTRGEVEATLAEAGLEVEGVGDAPDRPGLEYVFMTRRPG